MPSGMNAIPIAKKAGRTVPAVRMGCQAGNFCCLNLVSFGLLLFDSGSAILPELDVDGASAT